MDHIQNPLTGEDVSIYSKEATQLIKKYIKLIQSGGKRKGKGKGKKGKGKDRVLTKQKEPNLLIPILVFIKNMMNNPNKSEFEEYMNKKPKVNPDFLNFFKTHISNIEGPGLEKFILFILFCLGKDLKKQQKGGSNAKKDEEIDSDASTVPEIDSNATTVPEIDSDATTEDEESEMNGDQGQIIPFQGELALPDQLDESIDEEESKSNIVPNMFKFLWFAIFIGLVSSICKTTYDLSKKEFDYKKPIFDALTEAASNIPGNLKELTDLGQIIKNEESRNTRGDLDLITFSTSTHTDGEFLDGLVVYEDIQEDIQEEPRDDTSENGKITIYESEYEFEDLVLGYNPEEPITLTTIASAVYHSDPNMLLDVYETTLVAGGVISDTIQRTAMSKLRDMPDKLIAKAGNRLLNPNDPITLRASRFYSFTKPSYALAFGSSIALKEIRRATEDIQKDTSRYIEDIQTAVTRAMEDELEGFSSDILSYIYLLRGLLGSLATLFLIPLYKKITGKKIEDGQSSPEINEIEGPNNAITD